MIRHAARLFLASTVFALSALAGAQGVSVRGTVRDSTTQAPMTNARLTLLSGTTPVGNAVATDGSGSFIFRDVPPGTLQLSVTALGYRPLRVVLGDVGPGLDPAPITINMVAHRQQLQGVVVAVSRRPETALDAPATTHVVQREELTAQAAPTIAELVRSAPGFDVAGGGVMQSNMVARGFNALFSGELLTLVDHRSAFVPSLRVNVTSLMAPATDDIERIELVLGPGAAIYGPNATSGVLHVITRSPLASQGTTVAIDGGERGFFRGSARTAWTPTPSLGIKVSGEYAKVSDWQERDTVEEALISARDGAPRDYRNARASGEVRADWAVNPTSRITATVGRAELLHALEPTGESGVAQVKGWSLSSYQLRGESGRFSANVFLNKSDAGETTPLRSGLPLVDQSTQMAAQLQHGFGMGTAGNVRYGADFIRTNPVTGGTINGRNEDHDRITERGVYAHGEWHLTPAIDVTVAGRADWHSEFTEPVYSPRLALVWKPSPVHAIRATFNQAYNTPANYQFFVDEFLQPLNPALPYGLRLLGVPDGGFRFSRDCAGGPGGLCMRSPFAPSAGFIPAAAAPLWAAAVEALAPSLPPEVGPLLPLLRSLAPTGADVATQLAMLNLAVGAFDPVTADNVLDFDPLRPTRTTVLELGYKGLVAGRLAVSADAWTQRRRDFVFLAPVTPNVFFDATSLTSYLTAVFTQASVPVAADVAAQLAAGFAAVPLGTVQPDQELVGADDIALSYRNAGSVDVWGADLGVEADISPWLAVAATYAHLSRNLFAPDEIDGLNEVPLNAPRHKATLAFTGYHPRRGTSTNLRVRYVNGFPVRAGVFQRDVPTYVLVDAGFSVRPASLPHVTWSVTASNLLDHRHYEFAGTPRLGRLVITRVQYNY